MGRQSSEGGSSAPIERRVSHRRSVLGRASVSCHPESAFDADAVDISEGGVCLTSPVALQPGTLCQLKLEIHPAPVTHVCVSGRVCFCIEQSGHYRVGVQCSETPEFAAAVRRREAGEGE
jgi:hypothetical protein